MELIKELDEIYLEVDENSFSGHEMILIITTISSTKVNAPVVYAGLRTLQIFLFWICFILMYKKYNKKIIIILQFISKIFYLTISKKILKY